MTEEEIEALRTVVREELEHEAHEAKPGQDASVLASAEHAFKRSLKVRCALFVSVFIVGGLLHYLIEESALRTYAQSCELALAAAFDFIFNKARE